MEPNPDKPRRAYKLSPEGLANLRAAAHRNRPWEHSTGPRTVQGKRRSSQNAFKYGFYTAEQIAQHRELRRSLRLSFQISGVMMKILEARDDNDAFWDLLEELACIGDEGEPSGPFG